MRSSFHARGTTSALARGAVLVAAWAGVFAGSARDANAQTTVFSVRRSPYEESKIALALKKTGREVELDPEGKILEGVDVVPLEVIEDDDPAPAFLNIFHTTTRRSVLRREVLLQNGEVYRQYRVEESVRALRAFQQLSLVLAIPVQGSSKDRVRVLLVTKDVWSLRTQFDIKVGAGGLDVLRFEPTERNIAGTLDSLVTRFELLPESLTLGTIYISPRIQGRKLYGLAEANVVINRNSGEAEGSFGRMNVNTPQLSADTPYVYGYQMVWNDTFNRRYVGAKLANFDARSTPELDLVPDVFHGQSMTQTAAFARSYGRAHKVDLMVGAELSIRRFEGLDPRRYPADIVLEYAQKRVPTSDDRAAPWFQVRAYESRFVRMHDYNVLGLQEDYRIGYDAWVRAYPVTRALGSTRTFLGLAGLAQYVQPVSDGLLRVTGEVVTDIADDVPTLEYAANLQMVTPRFFLGRIVFDAISVGRPQNYLNRRSGIGGDGRLRGYPSAAFLGENLVAFNLELRTRPVEILKLQIGGAAFFDMGDAFDGDRLRPKSSAGFGIRGLVPQLDRKVMRLDIAFPMVRDGGEGPVGFYIAFEQAFPVGGTTPPGVAPAQSILNPEGSALQ